MKRNSKLMALLAVLVLSSFFTGAVSADTARTPQTPQDQASSILAAPSLCQAPAQLSSSNAVAPSFDFSRLCAGSGCQTVRDCDKVCGGPGNASCVQKRCVLL
jgi:hypothetical protein